MHFSEHIRIETVRQLLPIATGKLTKSVGYQKRDDFAIYKLIGSKRVRQTLQRFTALYRELVWLIVIHLISPFNLLGEKCAI